MGDNLEARSWGRHVEPENRFKVDFGGEPGDALFTVWIDSAPSVDDYGYEVYVLHVEEHVAGTRIVGVRAYDDMVAEFDAMVEVLKTNPPQHITNSINEQMIVLLANFVELSRTPTAPAVEV